MAEESGLDLVNEYNKNQNKLLYFNYRHLNNEKKKNINIDENTNIEIYELNKGPNWEISCLFFQLIQII